MLFPLCVKLYSTKLNDIPATLCGYFLVGIEKAQILLLTRFFDQERISVKFEF